MSDITNLEHKKFKQNWQLEQKINDCLNARKLIYNALVGIDRSNENQPVGSKSAQSLEVIQTDYKDFFQKIPFVRDEYNKLAIGERLDRLRDNFDAQKDLDESCLEDIDTYLEQSITYLIDIQEKFKEANPHPDILRAVDEATRDVSATPTSDFIDNLPTEEPGAISDDDAF
jgi:hypothetical protein